MADRNINESIRKPRRTKGTPAHFHRNTFSLAVFGFAAITWVLYELWPQTRKLKKSIEEGKFRYSPELQQHVQSMRMANQDPALQQLIKGLKKREF